MEDRHFGLQAVESFLFGAVGQVGFMHFEDLNGHLLLGIQIGCKLDPITN